MSAPASDPDAAVADEPHDRSRAIPLAIVVLATLIGFV
jgi:hypothetical protein